jgi:hypothetical protein
MHSTYTTFNCNACVAIESKIVQGRIVMATKKAAKKAAKKPAKKAAKKK